MDRRTLKHTDLNVSRLCLGTMTFGKPADQEEATRMVDLCLSAGINFIDTANMYQLGLAEEMLGTNDPLATQWLIRETVRRTVRNAGPWRVAKCGRRWRQVDRDRC